MKPCPRSIFLIINMSQGLSCLVPGPSLLLKEWPWDNQTMSQGLSCLVPGTSLRMALGQSKCVPGPYFWSSICPRACHFLSLVHHYCLKNGPGTIEKCPRSIFTVVVWDVPGPSSLLEEWTWDYYWELSQVHFHGWCLGHPIITHYHSYKPWENSNPWDIPWFCHHLAGTQHTVMLHLTRWGKVVAWSEIMLKYFKTLLKYFLIFFKKNNSLCILCIEFRLQLRKRKTSIAWWTICVFFNVFIQQCMGWFQSVPQE